MTHTAINIPYSTATRPMTTMYYKTKSGAFMGLLTLIDTGADTTSMPINFMKQLGYTEAEIPTMAKEKYQVCGLSGCVPAYGIDMSLKILSSEEAITIPTSVKMVDDTEVLLGRKGLLAMYEIGVSERYIVFRRKHQRGTIAGKAPITGAKPVPVAAGTPGSVPPGSPVPAPITLPGGTGNIHLKFGDFVLTDQHAIMAVAGLGLVVALVASSSKGY